VANKSPCSLLRAAMRLSPASRRIFFQRVSGGETGHALEGDRKDTPSPTPVILPKSACPVHAATNEKN
jgi:hypothetical protein